MTGHGDGKAQAFNVWFKEYTMNAILQPVHLILYVALVSSAIELVKDNMIYALVAIGFLIPAEKFVKKMFGFEAETAGGLGAFAGGALAMSGIRQAANLLKGNSKKNALSKGENSSGEQATSNFKTRQIEPFSSFNNNQNNNGDEENSSEQDQNLDRVRGQQGQTRNENANQPGENDSDIVLPQGYIQDQQQREAAERREQEERERQEEARRQEALNRSPEKLKGYGRKRFIRGMKKAGKGIYTGARIGTRAAGMVAGASIGLAAGISTGDFSKAVTLAGTGAMTGNIVGGALGKIPDKAGKLATRTVDVAQDKIENYRYNKDKDMYGAAYATQQAAARINEREKAKFMKNKDEQAKYEEMAGRIARETGNNNIKAEDLMAASFDYQKAGITDDSQIETGLMMEAKHGGINGNKHENMIDIMGITKDYGKDYVLDEKKRNSMQELIKTNVSGERNQNEVWNLYTEALGMKEVGRRHAINPPNRRRPRR